MSIKKRERMLDLLTDQILFGLNHEESAELKELETLYPELKNDISLELTASAIGLTNLTEIEPMPESLRTKVLAEAQNFILNEEKPAKVLRFEPQLREVKTESISQELQPTFEFEPKRPFLQWLGWALAGFAGIALAFSLWTNLQKPQVIEVFKDNTPKTLSISEQYNDLLASAKDIRRTSWTNPKNDKENLGEVIWSEKEQKGFMRFKGLAANDVNKETYQLWIFDETQDEKTPVDGGVFDIAGNGEVIIPIDAKLKVQNPKLFAVTVEKPGGVVVSKREKIVALAKVQT